MQKFRTAQNNLKDVKWSTQTLEIMENFANTRMMIISLFFPTFDKQVSSSSVKMDLFFCLRVKSEN